MRLVVLLLFASMAFGGDGVVVRSIRFADFKKVSVEEIRERLCEREARLEVERPYRPEYAEEARFYIAELLAERGRPDAKIEIATKVVAPRSVEVRFRLLK